MNYSKYREIRSAEERREYMREHMRARREVLAAGETPGRGTKFSGDTLSNTWRAFCVRERPDLDVDVVFADFKDYWIANANQRHGKKANWEAAWRNWVRKQFAAKPGMKKTDGKITCSSCAARVSSHIDGLCDKCYAKR